MRTPCWTWQPVSTYSCLLLQILTDYHVGFWYLQSTIHDLDSVKISLVLECCSSCPEFASRGSCLAQLAHLKTVRTRATICRRICDVTACVPPPQQNMHKYWAIKFHKEFPTLEKTLRQELGEWSCKTPCQNRNCYVMEAGFGGNEHKREKHIIRTAFRIPSERCASFAYNMFVHIENLVPDRSSKVANSSLFPAQRQRQQQKQQQQQYFGKELQSRIRSIFLGKFLTQGYQARLPGTIPRKVPRQGRFSRKAPGKAFQGRFPPQGCEGKGSRKSFQGWFRFTGWSCADNVNSKSYMGCSIFCLVDLAYKNARPT